MLGEDNMHYENVVIKAGDTISKLASKYGYFSANWKKVWNDPKNSTLKTNRGAPEKIEVGDKLFIPIPWRIITKTLVKSTVSKNVKLEVKRDGQKGTQLRWVQTVNQSNQPIGTTGQFCVDACPADDADPFYWTSVELTTDPKLRKTFKDTPQRPAPTSAQGTTRWRAILSLVVVTGKRVTILESIYWGFDLTSGNVVSKIGPRPANGAEVQGHIALLKNGSGNSGTFKVGGWTFRN